MKKVMMVFIGVCFLVIAAGCSGMSQASSEQPKQASGHQQNDQTKKQDQQKHAIDDSFDWQQFSEKQSKKNAQQPTQVADTSEGIVPNSIKIPAINVDTDVVKKGIVKEGDYKGYMATPDNAVDTAWYKYGAKPGEAGSSIIAGHVDTTKGPGVFFNLKDLKKGDMVYIKGKDGKTLTFEVYDMKAYPRDSAPVYKIFGYTAAHVVRLLTCTGNFDYSAGTHQERLVVSAKLVENKS